MTFYSDSWPTARKEHRCSDCRRTIHPGEKYRRGAGMDGEQAWTWKDCEHCYWLLQIIPWDDEYHPETFDEWEPDSVSELRLKALWLKKWTRADGSLYPVPTITTLEDEMGFTRVVAVEATP